MFPGSLSRFKARSGRPQHPVAIQIFPDFVFFFCLRTKVLMVVKFCKSSQNLAVFPLLAPSCGFFPSLISPGTSPKRGAAP